MYNKILGTLMVLGVVLIVYLWFMIPQCPYCHEKLFENGQYVGEYRLHIKCIARLMNSYPMGCPVHGESYGKPTLGIYCEKCGIELRTYATKGEIDNWIVQQMRGKK